MALSTACECASVVFLQLLEYSRAYNIVLSSLTLGSLMALDMLAPELQYAPSSRVPY